MFFDIILFGLVALGGILVLCGIWLRVTRLRHRLHQERDISLLTYAMDHHDAGVAVLDPHDHRVLYQNKSYQCFAPDITSVLAQVRWDERTHTETVHRVDTRKEDRFLSVSVFPVIDNTGLLRCWVISVRDITQTHTDHLLQMQTRKLEAMAALTGGIAHDFNNIFSIIEGFTRLSQVADHDTQHDYTDRVLNAVFRGADLCRRMMTFSRAEVQTEDVIDCGQVLTDHAEKFIAHTYPYGGRIKLYTDFDMGCAVRLSEDVLFQIVSALLQNAIEAIDDAENATGDIILSVQSVSSNDVPPAVQHAAGFDGGRIVKLSVIDDGAGVAADIAERVFDPFFSTKDSGRGTGLGLSLVYALIKNAGGFVDFVSYAGEGTTVDVYLPESDDVPQSREARGHRNNADSDDFDLSRCRALVVDDEEDIVALTANMLRSYGMDVLEANNGNQALVQYDDCDGDIDVVITDVRMPELDGVQLAELIRSIDPNVNIIFMSGYPVSAQGDGNAVPVTDVCLKKPVDPDGLKDVICSVLQRQDGRQAGRVQYWQ